MDKSFWVRVKEGDKGAFMGCVSMSLGFVAVFLSVFLISETFYTIKEYNNIGKYPTSIPVVGKGEVLAIPDIASFTYSVNTTAVKASDASNKASEINKTVLDYLKSKGVEEKDVKTISYSLYPDIEYITEPCAYGYGCPQKQNKKGFILNETIQVKVRNADVVEEILGGISETEVENVSNVTYTIDDEDSLKRQARDLAIQDAKAQAKVIADSLGVKIGDIVSYYEESPYQPYPYGGEGYSYDFAVKAVPAEVPKGEQEITATVNISFEIK
jgi:uncharacterized protein YggE